MGEAIEAVFDGITSNIAVNVQASGLGASQSQFYRQHTFQTTSAKEEDAKLYRDMNAIREVEGERLKTPSVLLLSPKTLGQYSVGLELYFSFLKLASVLFFFVAAISVWPIEMNVKGEYLSDWEIYSIFDELTLANQPWLDFSNYTLAGAYRSIDNNLKYQIRTLVADVAYTSLFICFLIYYRVKSAETIANNMKQNLFPSDYAIEVKRLPPEVDEGKVAEHFRQFGEVIEVSLARNYNGKLLLYTDRSQLTIELGIAKRMAQEQGQTTSKKITELESRIQKFDDRIARKNEQCSFSHKELPVNRAYVVFNKSEESQNCLMQYRKKRRFCIGRRRQPSHLRFQGKYRLKVKRPPEPSNIIWENLEVKSRFRKLRKLLAVVLTLALMIMSVALMYWLKSNDTGLPKEECWFERSENLSFEEAIKEYVEESSIMCWCWHEGIVSIAQSSEKSEFCEKYVSLWQKAAYIRVISSIGIIVINFTLKFFLRRVSRFERMSTITKEQQNIMFRVFLAMFVNTTLITLFVNADFQKFEYVPFREYMFDGDYDDFLRSWYLYVGSAIVTTMLVSMVSPHFLNFFVKHPYKKCKICCCRRRRKTQHEMNQLYIGADHDIAGKTAIALNIIFSCFLYSGGIPLLNVICFCSLFFLYWIEKYLIIHYYRKPPVHDHRLNQQVMSLLPYAILLHCGFSLYMYGSDAIWPVDYEIYECFTLYDGEEFCFIDSVKISFVDRLTRYTSITLIVVMVLTCIVALFSYALVEVLRRVRKSEGSETTKPLQTYNEALEEMKRKGVASYDILANPKYTDLILALDHSARKKSELSTSIKTPRSKVRPGVLFNNFVEGENRL